MRIVLLLLFISVGALDGSLYGQKKVYSFDLPDEGDVLYYKLDNLPDDNVNVEFQNSRNAWNLSMLNAPTAHEFTFANSSTSIYSNFFPGARLVSFDLWKNEKFYKKIGNGLFLVGEVIKSDREEANPIIKKYTDPKPIYGMEISVGTDQDYQSKWEVLLNGREFISEDVNPDATYKLEVTETITEVIDDIGLLFLPRERYDDVLKMERRITSDYVIYEGTGRNEWIERDLHLSNEQLPIEIAQSTKEITFLSEESKEWLACIHLDQDDEVVSALFKSEKDQIRSHNGYDESNFFLYPNPTFGLVRLDFVNLPKDTYFLEVYNIIGKKLWSESYQIDGYTTIKADLGFLSKGTYLYSLSNRSGKKFLTRKMAIINP